MQTGSQWLRGAQKELSPLGEKVADLLGDLFQGIYHIDGEVLKADFSDVHQVRVCVRDNDFATYDGDLLTRLVFFCHEKNIRVSIKGAAHRYLWLDFCNVDRRGFFAERHPTIAESMQRLGLRSNTASTGQVTPVPSNRAETSESLAPSK